MITQDPLGVARSIQDVEDFVALHCGEHKFYLKEDVEGTTE